MAKQKRPSPAALLAFAEENVRCIIRMTDGWYISPRDIDADAPPQGKTLRDALTVFRAEELAGKKRSASAGQRAERYQPPAMTNAQAYATGFGVFYGVPMDPIDGESD